MQFPREIVQTSERLCNCEILRYSGRLRHCGDFHERRDAQRLLRETVRCLSWRSQIPFELGSPPNVRVWLVSREVKVVTEIPEHLLNRSKARRASASGESTGENTPAATPATTAAAATPAKAAEAPKPKPVVPDLPYVVAAKTRRKIPFWAMAGLGMLPVWAALYLVAIIPAEKVVAGPLAIGTEQYAGCAGCHGADGAGGAGRVLYQGEVLKTFPRIEDMLNFVYNGSQKYQAAGFKIYGNPDREGGAHAPLSYNGNPMPQQGEMAGGGLTEAQILGVVCHVRYDLSGADPASEEWKSEYETWCSPESPIFKGLEDGSTSFETIDKDFAALENAPGKVGVQPRATVAK